MEQHRHRLRLSGSSNTLPTLTHRGGLFGGCQRGNLHPGHPTKTQCPLLSTRALLHQSSTWWTAVHLLFRAGKEQHLFSVAFTLFLKFGGGLTWQ